MSRTDAHRPRTIWMADHPELAIELHDHRFGDCTLPANPAAQPHPSPCWYDLPWHVRTCGCHICTGAYGRRLGNRASRAAWRTMLRAAVRAGAETELEDLEGRALRRLF